VNDRFGSKAVILFRTMFANEQSQARKEVKLPEWLSIRNPDNQT
jgi:hypothetical protein